MRNFITGKITTKVTRNSKLLIRLEALGFLLYGRALESQLQLARPCKKQPVETRCQCKTNKRDSNFKSRV